jgi:N utilization substance protein A
MINKDFFIALEDLEREKGINKDVFINALESSLVLAYKKHYGEASVITVKLNPEKSSIRVFASKTVVEEVTDPNKEISLEEARQLKKSYKPGDVITNEVTPKNFGRIAAQAAKQVMLQKLREAEKNVALEEFSEKENEILTGVIRRIEGKTVYLDIGKGPIEGVLKSVDQVEGEEYNLNDRLKVYVKKVINSLKGPQVLVSRTSPGLVKRLYENEVPEIRQNIVVIKAIARDPGNRTKIAVYSQDKTVDPIGACVGNKGVRVNAVVSELGGEKIDIIPWCEDQLEFIAMSLSPAKVLMVQANYDEKTAKVIVPDDKLSLAIGKDGQNARLAAKLTGWKIDVKSYTQSKSMPEFADLNESRAADPMSDVSLSDLQNLLDSEMADEEENGEE